MRRKMRITSGSVCARTTKSRLIVETWKSRDFRRGFVYSFGLLAAGIWIASFAALVYFAGRISRPIQQLTVTLLGDILLRNGEWSVNSGCHEVSLSEKLTQCLERVFRAEGIHTTLNPEQVCDHTTIGIVLDDDRNPHVGFIPAVPPLFCTAGKVYANIGRHEN